MVEIGRQWRLPLIKSVVMNEELSDYLDVQARHISQRSFCRRCRGDMGEDSQVVISAVDEKSSVKLNVVYMCG